MEHGLLEVKEKPDGEDEIFSEEQNEKAQEVSAGEITLEPQSQPQSQDIQHGEKFNLLCKNFMK